VPRKKALALHAGDYKVPRSSQLDYTILSRQAWSTSKFTFQLLPNPWTVSVPKDIQVTAWTHAAAKKIGIAHVSTISSLKDHAGYTKFQYTRASSTDLGKIHRHELPILINCRSAFSVVSAEVARELNMGWKGANWKIITANGNQSDLMKVAKSVPVNVLDIIILMPMIEAKSRFKKGMLRRPWETLCSKWWVGPGGWQLRNHHVSHWWVRDGDGCP